MMLVLSMVMRLRPWPVLATLLVLPTGCASVQAPIAEPATTIPSLVEAKRQVDHYVTSGRYEADIAAVVAQAKAHLEQRLAAGGKLAIVLDVDETALSNLPWLRVNDWAFIRGTGPCDLKRGPCPFGSWRKMARAEPIKPVLGLARFARERGVAVFFITAGPERFRAGTEQNLRAAGYEWTGLIMKPDDLRTKSNVEFKAPERKKLTNWGYTIVLNVGDQMSDLHGGHAERTYKLPNPFYFAP